jgi:hypothetical protein
MPSTACCRGYIQYSSIPSPFFALCASDSANARKLACAISRHADASLAAMRPHTTSNATSDTTSERRGNRGSVQGGASVEDARDRNYFMPKVSIARPDGATLLDMYRSKQADMWAQIVKAQCREEVSSKREGACSEERRNSEGERREG